MKCSCSMETVQQNGRFTLFSSKFPSNIFYSLWLTCHMIFYWFSIIIKVGRLENFYFILFYLFYFISFYFILLGRGWHDGWRPKICIPGAGNRNRLDGFRNTGIWQGYMKGFSQSSQRMRLKWDSKQFKYDDLKFRFGLLSLIQSFDGLLNGFAGNLGCMKKDSLKSHPSWVTLKYIIHLSTF